MTDQEALDLMENQTFQEKEEADGETAARQAFLLPVAHVFRRVARLAEGARANTGKRRRDLQPGHFQRRARCGKAPCRCRLLGSCCNGAWTARVHSARQPRPPGNRQSPRQPSIICTKRDAGRRLAWNTAPAPKPARRGRRARSALRHRPFLGARPGFFRVHRGGADRLHLPAGKGGRHQHDAGPRRPGAHLHQQVHLRFGLGSIERGDTVVFWYPQDTTKSYIKRVIGAARRQHPHRRRPGIRERPAAGGRLRSRRLSRHGSWRDGRRSETVPPGRVFRAGGPSQSSRATAARGATSRATKIYGKAVFVYWPLDKMGRVRCSGAAPHRRSSHITSENSRLSR